ncbi:hypothetical protein HDE_06452 [Halotydeus destructor]|nr:hypothetical protein HDE_06452 [Halotydeus destructor]
MFNSCIDDDSPSHAFYSDLTMRHNDEDVKPILKKKDSQEILDHDSRTMTTASNQPSVRAPPPILKKRSSSETKAQIHPILKNKSREGSLDRLKDVSMPLIVQQISHQHHHAVHSILKKSSSEERPQSEQRMKPILKKSSFDECHSVRTTFEVKPILKRNRSESECSSSSNSAGSSKSLVTKSNDRIDSSYDMIDMLRRASLK